MAVSTRGASLQPHLEAALAAAGLTPRVRGRMTDRLAYAHDASHYLLVPEAVVVPASAAEVAQLFRLSAELAVPLTFRSGGTSLSGQAVSDGLLVDVRRHFRGTTVLDDGARVQVEPGSTIRSVNALLAPYGRKLGPDPASEAACTVGGVIANNSSGMACGIEQNAYQTLESLVLVLPSGSVVDIGFPDADHRLRALEPELHAGLGRLRDRVRGDEGSVRSIRRLFSMKNTMGYGINAFLDHDEPVQILAHLVVGSEGTLAFIARATLRTVPLHPQASTGLLVFDELAAATGALPALVETAPATVELLDAASLRVAQRDVRADAVLRALDVVGHAALLVEYREPTLSALEARMASHERALRGVHPGAAAAFTADAPARAALWHIGKGLYAAVAGARAGAARRHAPGQGALRPHRPAQPRGHPQRRRARAPAPPQGHPRGGAGGRPVRRAVTANRSAPAGTSPRRPASASSCGGRWRALRAPETSAFSSSCRTSTSTTRCRPARSTVCARRPAPSRSTPATWSSDYAPRATAEEPIAQAPLRHGTGARP